MKLLNSARAMVFIAIISSVPNLSHADLSGTWIMTAEYARPDATIGTGITKIELFQNEEEVVGDTVATSNSSKKGRIFGRIINPKSNEKTQRAPLKLIHLYRVDIDGGGYKAMVIASVSPNETVIDGFFVDVNGVKGVIVMRKQQETK